MIYVVATLKIDPATLPQMLPEAQKVIAATRAEEGCILYELHQSVTDPSTLRFVEKWESMAALDAHAASDHLKAWRAAAGHLFLDRKIEIIEAAHVEHK